VPFAVRTKPRELPPRYIKPGDEIALQEVDADADDSIGARWYFARSADYVDATPQDVVWFAVVDGPHAIPPVATGRPGTVIRHEPGGWWTVDELPRSEFVPDNIDPVTTQRLMLLTDTGRPVVVHLTDTEVVVVRECVQVREGQPARAGITRDAGTRRVLSLLSSANREREIATVTAVLRTRDPQASDQGDRAALRVIGAYDEEERGSAGPGETTRRMSSRRIPVGVYGASMGRLLKENDTSWQFESERGQ
jgi:hypothetical protein